MLPRVTAAITQFIKPIASAAKRSTTGQVRAEREPPREQFQRQSKATLKVVPPPTAEAVAQAKAASPIPARQAQPGLSVTQTFLQIIALLKQGRGSIARWMGPRSYRTSVAQQKRRFRKGAMINIRAE